MAGRTFEIAFRLAGNLSGSFTSSFQTVAGNLQKTNQNISQLKQETKGLEAAQRKGSITSEEYAQKQKRISDELEKQQKKQQTLAQHLGAVDANKKQKDKYKDRLMSIAVASAPLAVAVKLAMDFESAFAGVKKTVDGTPEQLKAIENGIRKMSKEIPLGTTEIAAISEAAGQLGIKTDNILSFTRVMADLGVTTNLAGEEAASSLAKFANITSMSQANFDRLGATIVALGNNLATTERDIVNMGMRLAAAGKQIGMSEAQIMSFAGALSSVGIEAEAGGTAFSKVMINMKLSVETGNSDLANFARVAGVSAEGFKTAFQQDAAGALQMFIKGLAGAKDKGESAIKVLDDMGITEVRMRDSLLRASGASDVFADSLELGTKAWQENTALADEARQRYATTTSQMEMMRNRIGDIGITVGSILLPALNTMMQTVSGVTDKIVAFAEEHPLLTKYVVGGTTALLGIAFAMAGIGYTIAFLKGGILNLTGYFLKMQKVTRLAAISQWLFNTALFGCPIIWIIAGIAAVIGVGYLLYKNWDKIIAKTQELWGIFKEKFPALAQIVETYVGFVISFWTGAWERLVAIFNGTMEFLKALMAGDFEKCGEIVGRFAGKVVKWFSELPAKIGNELTWLGNTITTFFDKLPDMARTGFDSLVALAKTKFANLLPDWMSKGGVPPGAGGITAGTGAPAAPAQLSGWEKFKQGVSKGYGQETAKPHARGGFITSPHLGLVGEAGPEAIIPLDGSARAMSLWQQVGQRLGAFDEQQPSLGASLLSGGIGNTNKENVFSPVINVTINGNADSNTVQQIQQAAQTAMADFKRQFEQWQRQQRRTSYA